jgi:hypothetical protein
MYLRWKTQHYLFTECVWTPRSPSKGEWVPRRVATYGTQRTAYLVESERVYGKTRLLILCYVFEFRL